MACLRNLLFGSTTKKVVDLPIRSAFPIGKIQHHLQQIQVIRHFVLGCLKVTYNSELLVLGKVMN